MKIIDEPGMAYIVNDEPKPGLYRSWKVVQRGERYGVFFTDVVMYYQKTGSIVRGAEGKLIGTNLRKEM